MSPADESCTIIKIIEDGLGGGWVCSCCEEHDPLARIWDSADDAKTELAPDATWWEEEPGVWMADAARSAP